MEDYKVRLAAFEGPLDLLMHLIEKNKIDIYDIPIAEITRQYMEYLAKFREFNIEIASSFLVMAATLLQIKSRMMLPKQTVVDEDEEEDPRADLVRRLVEYKRFREVSLLLGDMASLQERVMAREPEDIPSVRLPPDKLPINMLVRAFMNVLKIRKELSVPEVIVKPEEYNIEDKMTDIMLKLQNTNGQMLFSDLFMSGSRTEIIVLFLALLELIKRKMVAVKQAGVFEDILVQVRT